MVLLGDSCACWPNAGKVRMVDDHSLDWVLGDHLSGVAVDALLPFIAVLDLEEIVWQAVLAMPERGLEEEHGAGETYSKYLDPTDAAVAIFPVTYNSLRTLTAA